MPRSILTLSLLLALAATANAAAPTDAASQRVAITLRAEASVAAGLVRLGDVADVSNGDAGRVAAWKAIELFPAPGEEVPRNVPRRAIQDIVALRLGAVPAAEFQGAASVRITTRAATPHADAATDGAARPISVARPRPTPIIADRKPVAPSGLMVVVTRRVVTSGHVLNADDVELRPAQGPQESAGGAARLEDVVGKETLRPIGIGQVVGVDSLRVPLVIHRNDLIRIIARTAGVRVETNGRAFGNASAGELVEVQTFNSRDKIIARAVRSGVVEVYGRGPSVAAQEAP